MNTKINFWLLGIAIILLGASIFLNISHTVITNESLVLTFIGILATIIVVGNFAQVAEIRNDTTKQINDLESRTQTKINELNTLYQRLSEASEKIIKIEKNTYYVAGEAYRLYAVYTKDKKSYKKAVGHTINAIYCYNLAGTVPSMIVNLLDNLLNNLKPENWSKDITDKIFNYDEYLKKVKDFPDTYVQKQDIIHLLELHQANDNKKNP
jgi:hypothetical protein